MNILIPTIGSRGDVQPFIALAQGLIRAGHHPTLATHPVMKRLVESHQVSFAPLGPDIDLAQEVAAIRSRARNPNIGLIRGMRFGFDILERSHADLLALCQLADLVVVPTAVAVGKNEAELSGLPYLSVSLMPWAIPWDDPDRSLVKRMIYRAIDGLVQIITTQPLNRIRKKQGLSPVGEEGLTSPRLNLVPVSPEVYPPNPLWEPRHRMVGYWFANPPNAWQPSSDLLKFLEADTPPVFISLGAMSLGDHDAFASASLFVEAIQRAGARGIIQGWEAGIQQLAMPPTIQAVDSLPHSWLMPQCAAVVHHGGFGTTAASLRAGKPALVIPHIADQFYWGQQIYQLGVGPRPIPRTKLNPERLAVSLEALIRNEELHKTASHFGKRIRDEKGVENAISLIEGSFG